MDVVIIVPYELKYPPAPGTIWFSVMFGRPIPVISPGERVYCVYHGRLAWYSPLSELVVAEDDSPGTYRMKLVRCEPVVRCTLDREIEEFNGWCYRFWKREEEKLIEEGS